MTVKEQIIRRVLDLDDAQAQRLLDQLPPRNGGGNDRRAATTGVHHVDATGDDGGRAAAGSTIGDDWAGPIAVDDPLWTIIGALSGPPDGPGDVARNHDAYLAEAYAENDEP